MLVQEAKEDFTNVCLHGFAEGEIKPDYLAGPLSFSALLMVRGAAFVDVAVVVVIDKLVKSALLQGVIVRGRCSAEFCFIAR